MARCESMRTPLTRIVVLALAVLALMLATVSAVPAFARHDASGAPIRAIVADQVVAWNAGDASGYARHVAPGVPFTTRFGMVMNGRSAFEQRQASTLTTRCEAL
jgi:hypothetical protein